VKWKIFVSRVLDVVMKGRVNMKLNESVKEYIDRVIKEMLTSPREEPKRRKKRVEKTRQLLNEAAKKDGSWSSIWIRKKSPCRRKES
jgi:hypothetical protein